MKDIFRLLIGSFDVFGCTQSQISIFQKMQSRKYIQKTNFLSICKLDLHLDYFFCIESNHDFVQLRQFISSPLIFHTDTNNIEFHLDLPFKRRKRIVLFLCVWTGSNKWAEFGWWKQSHVGCNWCCKKSWQINLLFEEQKNWANTFLRLD